jgi:hypothetical protein
MSVSRSIWPFGSLGFLAVIGGSGEEVLADFTVVVVALSAPLNPLGGSSQPFVRVRLKAPS